MMRYDAEEGPDARAWLAASEGERALACERHHAALTSPHARVRNPRLHAAVHAVVENQLASGEPPEAPRALARLRGAGLSRHEAVHAIGLLVSNAMAAALEGRRHDPAAYARELDALTADSWRALAAGEGEPA
jgi:hypothetical protein